MASALAVPMISSLPATRHEQKPIKPKRLSPGDTIAIVSPAGVLQNPESLQGAITKLESLGFRTKVGENISKQWGYFAGRDEERLADLVSAFQDPEIAAIIPIRGGYGSSRLLNRFPFDIARKNPKILMGYSDITALLIAITQKTGLITFHGPLADSTYSDFTTTSMKQLICEPKDPISVSVPDSANCLVSGKAKGKLIGGNLSVLTSLLGTPYFPRLSNCILFLEDVNEDPYRVDRMLTSLLLSPDLQGLSGLIFGGFRTPAPKPENLPEPGFTMSEVLQERAGAMGVPAISGLKIGHMAEKCTLPLGVWAELDADNRTLQILESAVS